MHVSPSFVHSLHFVGIGGIGMSGIAEVLHNQGYAVRGSDVMENANVLRLRGLGIPVVVGHAAENIRGADALVISTAIESDNIEVRAARERGVPITTRGEMLAEVARLKRTVAVSGSHGKTTTTSLIASVFSGADLDPTIINGGILNTYHTNARLGNGEWVVVEADESDGSFLKLPSIINVITNIDLEHMGFYQTANALEKAFRQFVYNLPFYGLGVLCSDHPRVRALMQKPLDRRIVTYGWEGHPTVRGENLRYLPTGVQFDVAISAGVPPFLAQTPQAQETCRIQDLFLPMFGAHNALNALAAVAIANELGIDMEVVRRAFAEFAGVKRRFTIVGACRGATLVDDYAHHPAEIAVVLKAAQQVRAKRRIVIFQPHRFTRMQALWDDFVKVLKTAEHVIVAPVHSAGEKPIEGIEHGIFAQALRTAGTAQVDTINNYDELLSRLAQILQEGDLVIGMGAGSISDWMARLYADLA